MTTPKRRSFIIIAVIILVVAIVLSSFVYLNSQQNYSGKAETITFGDLGVDSSELVYVAQNQRYFQQNGINFVIQTFETSTQASNAVLSNDVDLATSGEYTIVASAMANQNMSIIANTDKYQGVYLIANTPRNKHCCRPCWEKNRCCFSVIKRVLSWKFLRYERAEHQ